MREGFRGKEAVILKWYYPVHTHRDDLTLLYSKSQNHPTGIVQFSIKFRIVRVKGLEEQWIKSNKKTD